MQLSSKQAQSALLKVIEEVDDNCFFIFATTDPQDLLPTIISRSLVVPLNLISNEALMERLNVVLGELNVEVSEDIKRLIVEKSHGHGRNMMMLLDNYLLLGEEHFKDFLRSSVDTFVDMLVSMFTRDLGKFKQCIEDLQTFSLSDLNADYNLCVNNILKGCVDDTVDYAGDLRSGASYTKYLYFLYDGNGTYAIEFNNCFTEEENTVFKYSVQEKMPDKELCDELAKSYKKVKLLYDGNGTYAIEFNNWSDKVELEFEITK